MSSRSSSRLASPWWVAPDASARAEREAQRPRPVPSPARGERASGAASGRSAPLFERAARRRPDTGVAVALATLWVALWAVFTAGVVLPAAGVNGGQEQPPAQAAQAARAAP